MSVNTQPRAKGKSSIQFSRRKQLTHLLAASAACAPAFLATRAHADQLTYVHPGTGDWDSSADPYFSWRNTTFGTSVDVPPLGSTVSISQFGTNGVSNATVNLNYAYAGTNGIADLTIDSSNGILHTSGTSTLVINRVMNVGSTGIGSYTHTAGLVLLTGTGVTLALGVNPGSSGTYTLGGSALLIATNNATASIGVFGAATFNQFSGTHRVSNASIGAEAAGIFRGNGFYNLTGGTFDVLQTLRIGELGDGSLSNSGGKNTVNTLTLGGSAGGSGVYVLSGTGTFAAANVNVGILGLGSFNHFAGSATVSNSLNIGAGVPNSGFYFLETGSLTAATINVAAGGQFQQSASVATLRFGQFNQSGGLVSIGFGAELADLSLDAAVSSTPSYNLTGGSLQVLANTYVGRQFVGTVNATFNQSGGTHSIANDLYIGFITGNTGLYNLNGTNSATALSVGRNEYVGFFGDGRVTQTASLHTIAATGSNGLFLAFDPAATGRFSLSGGTLSTSAGTEYIGYGGAATFTQTGGTNTTLFLTLAALPTSTGTYSLSAGRLTVNSASLIGSRGTGVFNHTGGTHSTNFLQLGDTGIGTYNLSGSAVLNAGFEFVGYNNVGTFNQTGGTNNTLNLVLSNNLAATGTYNLSGPAVLNVTGTETIGNGFLGTFNQLAGAHAITGSLIVSGLPGASIGAFNLQGGSLVTPSLQINGSGSFTQSNGSLTASNVQIAGTAPNPFGGGSTTAGLFALQAGTASLGTLLIAPPTGGATPRAGALTQSGGALIATSTTNHGAITQSAGVSTLGPLSGTGSVTLGSGSGSAAIMTVASFNQSGITIKNTGTLHVASNAARFTNTTTALTISGNGTLDLANHALLVDAAATPLATIQSYVLSARGTSGLWTGPGLTSATVTADPQHLAIAYANGTSGVSAGGVPGKIYIRPSLIGDANLNGAADNGDISQIIARGHYLDGTTNNTWVDGDFNYDGLVNNADISLLIASGNYLSGATFFDADHLQLHANPPIAPLATAPIPEPSCLALAAAALLGLSTRRRKK